MFTTTTRGPPRRRSSSEHEPAVVVQEGVVPAPHDEVGDDDDDVAIRVRVAELLDVRDERREELPVGRLAQDEPRDGDARRARRAADELLPHGRELADRAVLREDVERPDVVRELDAEAQPAARQLVPRLHRDDDDRGLAPSSRSSG